MSSTIAPASNGPIIPHSGGGFQSFESIAADAVLSISYNSSGKRLAIASADHKVRIYDKENQNSEPHFRLIDQWRAHDAEIFDVQWVPGPFPGHFATIASDNKFKIWREDPSQAPRSGRRFRCIFSQSPAFHVAYTSFSFHTREPRHEVYLSLFTQDGLLSLLESSGPNSLSVWREIDQLYPFGRHGRGTEPRFCLSFHKSLYPSSQALTASLPRTTLSLTASAGAFIKIYRALPISLFSSASSLDAFSPHSQSQHPYQYPESTNNDHNNSHNNNDDDDNQYNYNQLTEFLELELPPAKSNITTSPIINHVAWAPGCLAPWDNLAAACDDGTVRIIEVLVPPPARNGGILKNGAGAEGSDSTSFSTSASTTTSTASTTSTTTATGTSASSSSTSSSLPSQNFARHAPLPLPRGRSTATAPSGIGAGLAGISMTTTATNTKPPFPAEWKHEWRQSAVLRHSRPETNSGLRGKSCWSVKWVYDGSALASVGDDAEVVLWRRGVSMDLIQGANGNGGGDGGRWLEWSRTGYEG